MLPAKAHGRRRAALIVARTLTAGLAALALLAAGCGDEDDDSSSRYVPDTSAEDPYLEVTLDPDGKGGEAEQVEIAGCTDGASACAEVKTLSAADFEPVPPNVACTEIYGGADTASLQGTLDGEDVSATFTRENGCEIDRFERIAPLLQALFPDYEPGSSLMP